MGVKHQHESSQREAQARIADKRATNQQTADHTASHSTAANAVQELKERTAQREIAAAKNVTSSNKNLDEYAHRADGYRNASAHQKQDIDTALGAFAGRQAEHLTARKDAIDNVARELENAVGALVNKQSEALKESSTDRHDLTKLHASQWTAVNETIEKARTAIEMLRADDDARLAESRTSVQKAATDPGQLRAALDRDAGQSKDRTAALERDASRLLEHVQRSIEGIENRMGPKQLESWRQQLGAFQLSDDALERVRQEGRRVSNPEKRQAREWAIKGQLMEEIAISQALVDRICKEETDRLRKAGIDKDVIFVAGDRIRDDQGKKITDGLFAWKDDANRWHAVHAFEAKAGAASARALEKIREEITAALREETARYARDVIRDEKPGKSVQELTEHFLKHRTELGQLTKTDERIASANDRLYVDGQAWKLANEGQRIRTTGLVTSDSKFAKRDDATVRRDAEMHQTYLAAAISAAQLTEIARRLNDLLDKEEA